MNQAEETLIVEAVRAVAKAEILPRFRALAPSAIKEKSSAQDLVTEADRAASSEEVWQTLAVLIRPALA